MKINNLFDINEAKYNFTLDNLILMVKTLMLKDEWNLIGLMFDYIKN